MHKWSALLVALAVVGCGGEGAGNGGDTGGDTGSAGGDYDAATLAELESEIDGYESWGQTTDATGIIATAGGPHGDWVQVWWNQAALDTVNAAAGGDMPDGAVIVKQGYNTEDGSDKANLTVMYKTGGEWFWAAYAPDGSLNTAGQPEFCTSCHASGQDEVLTTTW